MIKIPHSALAGALWTAVLSLNTLSAEAADAPPTVLTGTQATYSLTHALVQDTHVRIENVPADGRRMSLMTDYISRRMDRLGPLFASATAVVSLTNALPGDPIYRFARQANIRIVDIDAALPWSLDKPGVALVDSPESDVDWGADTDPPESATAPYFWLSVSNAIRMADLIADDLIQLFPDSEAAIARNLDALKRSLLNLRNEYQRRLIEAGRDTVFALTGDFVYLTNDMGLNVDGYFIKQDIRWTDTDLANLTRHLEERDIKVVIHEWMPSDAIQAAIREAGATVVVLDSGDPGIVEGDGLAPDGLQRILESNLRAVSAALAE